MPLHRARNRVTRMPAARQTCGSIGIGFARSRDANAVTGERGVHVWHGDPSHVAGYAIFFPGRASFARMVSRFLRWRCCVTS